MPFPFWGRPSPESSVCFCERIVAHEHAFDYYGCCDHARSCACASPSGGGARRGGCRARRRTSTGADAATRAAPDGTATGTTTSEAPITNRHTIGPSSETPGQAISTKCLRSRMSARLTSRARAIAPREERRPRGLDDRRGGSDRATVQNGSADYSRLHPARPHVFRSRVSPSESGTPGNPSPRSPPWVFAVRRGWRPSRIPGLTPGMNPRLIPHLQLPSALSITLVCAGLRYRRALDRGGRASRSE